VVQVKEKEKELQIVTAQLQSMGEELGKTKDYWKAAQVVQEGQLSSQIILAGQIFPED